MQGLQLLAAVAVAEDGRVEAEDSELEGLAARLGMDAEQARWVTAGTILAGMRTPLVTSVRTHLWDIQDRRAVFRPRDAPPYPHREGPLVDEVSGWGPPC